MRLALALLLLAAPALAQETLPPATWTRVDLNSNWVCQSSRGETLNPAGSDFGPSVSRVCNDWSELEGKLRELGIVLVRISAHAWTVPDVIGQLAGGPAEAVIDAAAATRANIDYRSRCVAGATQYEVLETRPPSGTEIEAGAAVILVVHSDSMCEGEAP